MNSGDREIYDVVGVGFGPSGLALAIALAEHPAELSHLFLEQSAAPNWHRGMLLPGARMQVAFLKDLATFRNPASRFSFVSYLHQTGRLAQFVNNRDFFATRHDFHTYLEWAETGVAERVRRGTEVTGMRLDGDTVRVDVRGSRSVHARNVVISTGLVPRMPAGVDADQYVWHSSRFLDNFRALARPPRRVVVAGAGQSAAEIARFLYDELPDASIHVVLPSFGYSAADSTPFANRVFDPEAMGDYHSAPAAAKEMIWRYHKNTNYSVVDEGVLQGLHQRAYDDELSGRGRLKFLNMTRVLSAKLVGNDTRVTVHSALADRSSDLDVDLLVCATGYEPMDPAELLGEIDAHCLRDDRGRYVVGRDHRLVTSPEVRCGIFLQGGTEHTHGLSSSLLSNIAVRSGEITDSIAGRLPGGTA
uniref:Peptide monooxygenase n=1 Tax=uncultured bacterium esnapd7 TaxID=1366614 RepID=S5TKN5_9BACT|nr:peptide monooxygenase [uncultured bacterium esnapd7]